MFAALYIRDFSVVAVLRGRQEFAGLPCAILATAKKNAAEEKSPLAAINQAARQRGLAVGWPLNRALVRCPELRVLPRDPAAEAALLAECIELAESLTPDVEVTAADGLILDFCCPSAQVRAALDSLELPAVELWHAQAATPDLAYLAARHASTQGRSIVSKDLAAVPLDFLDCIRIGHHFTALKLLETWGMKTLGDFMALPRQALTERLGLGVGHWHDLLHGKTCRLLRLHRPPECLTQRVTFEEPLTALEPLIFSLKRLLHTLSGRLAARHLAASFIELRLLLETGGEVPRRIHFPEPQSTVEGMLGPLQTWLDSLKIRAAVSGLELDAETSFAVAAQREWFGRQLPQPERWAETLAKLEALLGPDRVGIPVPVQTHAPDSFHLSPAAGLAQTQQAAAMPLPACTLPLQRYRPPLAIAVAHEVRDGHPLPLALLTGPHPGQVLAARGPFPASGTWWQPTDAWQRLEWDIQIASHHLLRLVLEKPDRWKLEGIYQ